MGECRQQKDTQHTPPMKTGCEYLNGWIKKKKKKATYAKISPKMVNPRDLAGERRRRRRRRSARLLPPQQRQHPHKYQNCAECLIKPCLDSPKKFWCTSCLNSTECRWGNIIHSYMCTNYVRERKDQQKVEEMILSVTKLFTLRMDTVVGNWLSYCWYVATKILSLLK